MNISCKNISKSIKITVYNWKQNLQKKNWFLKFAWNTVNKNVPKNTFYARKKLSKENFTFFYKNIKIIILSITYIQNKSQFKIFEFNVNICSNITKKISWNLSQKENYCNKNYILKINAVLEFIHTTILFYFNL